MTYPNDRDCEHGQLRRQCNICDLEEEITTLKAEREKLVAVLREVRVEISAYQCGGIINKPIERAVVVIDAALAAMEDGTK